MLTKRQRDTLSDRRAGNQRVKVIAAASLGPPDRRGAEQKVALYERSVSG